MCDLLPKNQKSCAALSVSSFQAIQYLLGHPTSETSALWKLLSDPVGASKSIADRCMNTFGKAFVQKAVLLGDQSGLEPLKILTRFHKKSFLP